jgi:hypothetical protein
MRLSTPPWRWRLTRLPLASLCLGLSACAMPAYTAGAAGSAAHGISEVTLERDCFGCASATRIELRSDGTARFTQVGKARHGTEDQVLQGRISRPDFDMLAALLLQRGFFQMSERYDPTGLADGAWLLLRATRAGQSKEVFAREDAAPPDLRAIETAIDAIQRRVATR